MLHLNEIGVNVFINRYKSLAAEAYWDNYDLMIWEKNHKGFFDVRGMFRKDSWGTANKFEVNDKGNWTLPKKYVRYFK
jgi:hypothetical protein